MFCFKDLDNTNGWEILTRMAANSKSFAHSSSHPIKAVVSNRTAAGLSVGYFARPKIQELGQSNLGFVLPKNKTILNTDPISIIKNSRNSLQAKRFVDFILSVKAQKLLILSKGNKEGPRFSSLARMAVNKSAYNNTIQKDLLSPNPFTIEAAPFKLDLTYINKTQFVLADLIGTVLVDLHDELVPAWRKVIKTGLKKKDVAKLCRPPVSRAALIKLATSWENQAFRNQTINRWYREAKIKYSKLGE